MHALPLPILPPGIPSWASQKNMAVTGKDSRFKIDMGALDIHRNPHKCDLQCSQPSHNTHSIGAPVLANSTKHLNPESHTLQRSKSSTSSSIPEHEHALVPAALCVKLCRLWISPIWTRRLNSCGVLPSPCPDSFSSTWGWEFCAAIGLYIRGRLEKLAI